MHKEEIIFLNSGNEWIEFVKRMEKVDNFREENIEKK
jgi:hypothetical protein